MNNKNDVHISVVIPVYMCEECLLKLYFRLIKTLSKITNDFEIIIINDSSPDGSWDIIKEISEKDKRVKGLSFSRNFGQHYAITAGLEYAKGNWIIVMDCDLQDQPEEIIKLYNKVQEGYDVVFGQRENRQDGFFKKLSSTLFYRLLSYLTDTKQDPTIANFGIYSLKSIKAVLLMKDKIKYLPVMVRWVGFNSTEIKINHASRENGKSSYSFSELVDLSFDIIFSFSDKPLKLFVKLGFLISTLSFLFTIYILIKALVSDYIVPGWASTMISMWFLGGLTITVLGVVGIYVGKTFNQTKDRPIYIIKDKT